MSLVTNIASLLISIVQSSLLALPKEGQDLSKSENWVKLVLLSETFVFW